MTDHPKNPSDSSRSSSAPAPSAVEGLGWQRDADGAPRKRSLVQWILLVAILILPW
jgi:hypothetical protein